MRMARAEGAQANNKRAARQCEKRRWFAPRKVSVFFVDYGPKGAGGQAKSHLAFLPEYLYPVGFSANSGPKGTGGNEGKRVPSGHNRRRRLAPRSSGKQQAERTAVRTAPMVCPEESPQCARRRKSMPHRYADSPKGCRGERREDARRVALGQPGLPLAD